MMLQCLKKNINWGFLPGPKKKGGGEKKAILCEPKLISDHDRDGSESQISALECCICETQTQAMPLNSQGPFLRASGPSVTGLLVNCHTDSVTHGQII